VLAHLDQGEIGVKGQFLWGSNSTNLVEVACGEESLPAVYKPTQGVRPLWDFDPESLAKREVAAYLVSEALGWSLVPPTTFREHGPFGPGSLQLFIEHDPEYHFFNFNAEDRQRLRAAAAFDILINNADRKGGHLFFDQDDHLWLIDHGICFHVEPKLRTVVWDFSGEEIPGELAADLRHLKDKLKQTGDLAVRLADCLSPQEDAALQTRLARLLRRGVYPNPPKEVRPYPWPLI